MRRGCQNGCNHLLVLFGFQRARGVDHRPARTHGVECRRQNRPLPLSLPWQVFRAKSVTNLRIAPQRARAAARYIDKSKIKPFFCFQRGRIRKPAFNSIGVWREPVSERLDVS